MVYLVFCFFRWVASPKGTNEFLSKCCQHFDNRLSRYQSGSSFFRIIKRVSLLQMPVYLYVDNFLLIIKYCYSIRNQGQPRFLFYIPLVRMIQQKIVVFISLLSMNLLYKKNSFLGNHANNPISVLKRMFYLCFIGNYQYISTKKLAFSVLKRMIRPTIPYSNG